MKQRIVLAAAIAAIMLALAMQAQAQVPIGGGGGAGSGSFNAASQAECEALVNNSNGATPLCISYALNSGVLDGVYADYAAPFRVVSSDPATCTVDQWVWNTTVSALKRCSATNTWTADMGTVKKCTAGTSTTGSTTAVSLGSYTFASGALATGDIIRISVLWTHAAGVNTTLDSAPRHYLQFGTSNTAEVTWGAASDTAVETTGHIYVIGPTTEHVMLKNYRQTGAFLAAGAFTSMTEAITAPAVSFWGRSSNVANDDVLTLAQYCVELVKGVL